MKKYSFKLQRVLDLKKIHESQAQKKLGGEVRALREVQERLQEAQHIKSALDHRFHDLERVGSIDPVFFRRFQSYQMTLGQDVLVQQERYQEQESVVDEAREHLQLAHRKTQVFEKLEEVSREAYWRDVQKEDEKVMNEVALQRFRRRSQTGRANVVLMAIGASGFVMGVLTLLLLVAMGSLNMNRLELIVKILRYREDHYKGAEMVKGGKDPHIVLQSDFEQLTKDAEAWRTRNDVDDTVVITKEIMDHRKNLLYRLEETVSRMQAEAKSSLSKISEKEAKVKSSLEKLAQDRQSFATAKKEKADAKKDKAQEEMLQAFKSMDPEDVVNVLTAGRELGDFPSVEVQRETVTKVADYVSKMGARQRAGILQALSPEWATTVVRHLEENFPL